MHGWGKESKLTNVQNKCLPIVCFIFQAKGYDLEYLSKVPEVKDTVHKHSLLYHVCNMIIDQFPDATDLYSELGAVTRCAKVCSTVFHYLLDKTCI